MAWRILWRTIWRIQWMTHPSGVLPVLSLLALLFQNPCADAKRQRDHDDLTVLTDKGRIRGVRYFLPLQEKVVEAYLGIPFAEPPVGYLRFKHPRNKEKWDGVLNCTRLPNSCYQNPDEVFGDFYGATMWNSPTRVSEDCLYLNVWVPKTHPKLRKSAVLVWIFGGGFYSGTTTLNLYDGKILAAENNLVVVSIGYRVGPFGFLTLGHPEAPGNAGLFDQLMALEWIQKNIRHFGGDPNNVTLFGESAGSVSVSMHLLSPLSRSKFNRAILQSGAASTHWATYDINEGRQRALDLATMYMDCPMSENMEDIAMCLRAKRAQGIADEMWVSRGIAQFPFVPVVDGYFLTETPEMSLKRGTFKKCPVIMGSNQNEGSFFVIYEILSETFNLNTQIMHRTDYYEHIANLFYYYPQYREIATEVGVDAIAFEYTNWLDPSDGHANFIALDQAVGDAHFVCQMNAFAHAYASAGENVFYYYFTQRYESNPWPAWMGVLHGDEILFAFGEPFKPGKNFTESEKLLSRKMMQYWTNFAKTGDPNLAPASESLHEWPLHTPQGKEHLELNDKHVHNMRQGWGRAARARQCAFWVEYLPTLLRKTQNLNKLEAQWKVDYQEWSSKYMADWKLQYDIYVRNANTCGAASNVPPESTSAASHNDDS